AVSLVLPQAASMSEAPAARAAAPMIRDLLRFLTVLAGISRLLVEGVRADAAYLSDHLSAATPSCRRKSHGLRVVVGPLLWIHCDAPGDRRSGVDEAAPQKGTVTQRAVEEIKAMIAEGRLEPGQRLPTERDLAARLG